MNKWKCFEKWIKFFIWGNKKKIIIFFLCQSIIDRLNQIKLLSKENISNLIETNKIILTIPTNMEMASLIILELKEIEKNINTKVEAINDFIINSEKKNVKEILIFL